MKESFSVSADEDGERLDRFLASRLEESTRSQIKLAIDRGAAMIEGKIGRPGQRLRPGQVVEFDPPPPAPTKVEPELIDIEIAYEDEQVIVVNKAAGMVVHPAAGNYRGTLVAALLAHCRLGGGEELRPGIVHRLDKDTSGLLVVAKDPSSHQKLALQFKEHTVGRRYLALVRGVPPEKGTFSTSYGRHPRHRVKFSSQHDGSRHAVTHFERLEVFDDLAALVACVLETGRTHQVRVHLSDHGHAVLGDELYGGRPNNRRLSQLLSKLDRQALHAHQLAFDHPRTGERIELESELPPDMESALETLRSGA